MKSSKTILWLVFAAFVAGVLYFERAKLGFSGSVTMIAARVVVWVAFGAFVAYTFRCSQRENLFKSVRSIASMHWGRQVLVDLYIGFALALALIGLNEGSWLAAAVWVLPLAVFGNLATLLYVAVNFDSLAGLFAR